MRARRRSEGLGSGETEHSLWLASDEDLSAWFRLPRFLMDDVGLVDALRPTLSRRLLRADTFWGTMLIGLEDIWCWLFYGRGWVERQVQKALGESRRPARRPPRCAG
jgi:hypothetical protein